MKKVAVIMGSDSDWPVVKGACTQLDALDIPYEAHILSAHRTPTQAAEFAKSARERGVGVVICAAGMAAHLAGAFAANTTLPVIGIPMKGGVLDGLDALLATVQMPGGIPVPTVALNGAKNAAVLAAQILAVEDEALTRRLEAERRKMAEQIAEKRKKKAPAYRLMVPDEDITFTDGCMGPHTENLLRDCGDFYLRRADGVFAYQLAVVVDDARMGVTEVVRGADLLSSTARQLYLYRLLGLPAPKFAHCPLLLAPDGRRLSKRDGDQSLENLRAKYTAEEIVGRLAFA